MIENLFAAEALKSSSPDRKNPQIANSVFGGVQNRYGAI